MSGFTRSIIRTVGAAIIAQLTLGHLAAAQTTVAAHDNTPTLDTRAAEAVLERPVTVDLSHVALRRAVDAVATLANARVFYKSEIFTSYTTPVSIHAVHVPLRKVFADILAGTRLRVVPAANGALSIEEGDARESAQQGGLTGTILDARTKRPISGASVWLDDSMHATRTDDRGVYHFASASVGTHRLLVRAVGFARQVRVVSVLDGQSKVIDFTLESSVNTLDQVVVTATGAQRYRELGHVVTQLNADSLVRSAPITTMAQLLQSRVPGLQVMTGNGGVAGGDVALQIRGQSTLNLDPQPIIIIDGVRYRSDNAVLGTAQGFGASMVEDQRPTGAIQRSPLNDLNVNDIESVEVVKGPSASTLYGPDAAGGVIVITTKRGQTGTNKWSFYLHPNLATITHQANRPQVGYWGWGHVPSSGALYQGSCTLANEYYGQCIQDSITVAPTAEAIPDLAVIARQRPQWQSGAGVSGGVDRFHYYFSGGYDSQVGSLEIPPAMAKLLVARLGESALSDEVKTPNSQQTISVRSNVSVDVNKESSIQFTLGYTRALQRQINMNAIVGTEERGPVQPGCTDITTCTSDYEGAFIQSTKLTGDRFTGGVDGTVHPLAWLTLQGTLGLDLDNTIDRMIDPKGGTASYDQGLIQDYRRDNTDRTGRLNATARSHQGRFSFQTTLGTDYHYTNLDGLNLTGQNLAPGSESITSASYFQTQQLWSEIVSLGTYGEEVLGVNDRLFLTGSLRYDGSTSFGDGYHPRPFPKLGLSWIASDEPFLKNIPGLDELRFRYSYGASSRYPTSQMKTGTIGSSQWTLASTSVVSYSRDLLANPLLRPERSRESEYGADATTLTGHMDIGLTWYHRRVADMIQITADPQGLPSQWSNVGTVVSHGWEATVTARLLETRTVQASLVLTGNFDTNKLVSLGTGATNNGCNYFCAQVGHPLGSIFDKPIIGVADTVGGGPDGIALDPEIVYGPYQYLGVTTPSHTYTANPSVSFLSGRVRLSTLLDRSTGFLVPDPLLAYGLTTDALLAGTPLIRQARTLTAAHNYVSGDFTRWRELSLSTDLPERFVHLALLSRGTVSFYVRNLALWTRDRSGDPESLPGLGGAAIGGVVSAPGITQPRSWSISFDFVP